MMKCPYCVSEIDSKALVCKYCKRDIFLPKQLLIRINDLEKKLKSSAVSKSEDSESDSSGQETEAEHTAPTLFDQCWLAFFDFAKFIVLPLVLLLLAHVCIAIVYDTKILYLRLITLILPMCFGILLCRNQQRNILLWFVWVISLGLIAVVGMSAMTSLVDGSPIWPQSIYEWRDMIEFAASISFSYLTGMFLGRLVFLNANNKIPSRSLNTSTATWMNEAGDEMSSTSSLQFIAKKISEFITAIGAVVTTIIAIYTGLKGLF